MPETAAVVLIAVVSVAILVFARIGPIGPSLVDPNEERMRISREIAWLEERLDRAQAERWHSEMQEPLLERLALMRQQAARLTRR